MGLNLTIDRGNTMTKVAIWDKGELLTAESLVKAETADILRVICSFRNIDRALLCTVAGGFENLGKALAEMGISFSELSNNDSLPIKIDYGSRATLGVDRIAAAAGAWSLIKGKDVLIVDIGTAVTYDRLTSKGVFAGGCIAPGIGMRLKALNYYTAALPLVNSRGATMTWGRSTETAMRSGAVNGVVAETSFYHSRLPKGGVTVVTGGWSREIAKRLDFEVIVDETLVSRGLNSILLYNENL